MEGEQPSLDVGATGYQAVREALQRVLSACVAKLTDADRAWAEDILDIDVFTKLEDETADYFLDTCLYSRPGDPFERGRARRPVDRIAPKLKLKGDPLAAGIAERLPHAFFSVFEITEIERGGCVTVKDLIDGGRRLEIMDNALAASGERGLVFAGRFVDLGAWHAGLGIVVTLKKSEAAAIVIASLHSGDLAEKREGLHEPVYSSRIHGEDLVMHALQPLILAMAMAIDLSDVGVEEFASQFTSALLDAGPQ